MGEEASYTGGIALIVEGATEKVFYSELIRLRALVHCPDVVAFPLPLELSP